MSTPLKYLVLVPDGVGIRNFFCTRFIDHLLETGTVCVWHDLPDACLMPFQARWNGQVRWESLPPIRDGYAERLFRQSKVYAQLFWQMKQGPDIQLKFMRPSQRWTTRVMAGAGKTLGRVCASPRGVVRLDQMHRRAAASAGHMAAYEAFLREQKPDVVFCAHQRALKAVPALLAARRLGIPTATFIYSWDNLPKGRMPVHADYYFVWSEFMKKELLGYYPDVSADRVRIVGTPQFENYFNEQLFEPREAFLAKYNLDPARPVVCFSGDDRVTSPHDAIYLTDLAEALRQFPAAERPQILFRRCPVDRSNRYDDVLRRHPEIAISNPLWHSHVTDEWSQIVPTQDDVKLLVNVARHSDLVVNVGSTMAMDFAIYDKPAIYICYNPAGVPSRWDIHLAYQLPHYATVHSLQPVYWARSPQELPGLVRQVLHAPAEKAAERRAWLALQVAQPLDRASVRCSQALQHLATGHRRH